MNIYLVKLVLRLVLALILPPLSVYLTAIERGRSIADVNFRTMIDHEHEVTMHLALNVALCFVFWVPAVVHAILYALWPASGR